MSVEIISGVYQIRNTVNGKVYVGSSVDLRNRWIAHRDLLRHGNHYCRHLQHAWIKHGELAFIFEIVELIERKEDLRPREQFYFDAAYALGQHYNTDSPTKNTRIKKPMEAKPLIPDGLISVQAAADQLGVSPRRIRVLCTKGRVQGAIKFGRDWLIPGPAVVMPGSRVRPGKIDL